jgi:hypothetical protein
MHSCTEALSRAARGGRSRRADARFRIKINSSESLDLALAFGPCVGKNGAWLRRVNAVRLVTLVGRAWPQHRVEVRPQTRHDIFSPNRDRAPMLQQRETQSVLPRANLSAVSAKTADPQRMTDG